MICNLIRAVVLVVVIIIIIIVIVVRFHTVTLNPFKTTDPYF